MAYYTVNGAIQIGGKEFYRVDDTENERVGLDFLKNPTMLVEGVELARKVVGLLNKSEEVPE